jgi:hypothetical protein
MTLPIERPSFSVGMITATVSIASSVCLSCDIVLGIDDSPFDHADVLVGCSVQQRQVPHDHHV